MKKTTLLAIVGAILLMVGSPSFAWWTVESINEATEGGGFINLIFYTGLACYLLWKLVKSIFDKFK
jgi:uncharacterized membrane protein YeiB